MAGSLSARGFEMPRSHLLTADSFTPRILATSRCVGIPPRNLRSRITFIPLDIQSSPSLFLRGFSFPHSLIILLIVLLCNFFSQKIFGLTMRLLFNIMNLEERR
nr:MAG TPA: hypothetical protein [Caudoviricetes sp.]